MRIRAFAWAAAAALATALAGPAGAEDEPAPAIEWTGGLEEAVERSAADGRPVILYFTFDT